MAYRPTDDDRASFMQFYDRAMARGGVQNTEESRHCLLAYAEFIARRLPLVQQPFTLLEQEAGRGQMWHQRAYLRRYTGSIHAHVPFSLWLHHIDMAGAQGQYPQVGMLDQLALLYWDMQYPWYMLYFEPVVLRIYRITRTRITLLLITMDFIEERSNWYFPDMDVQIQYTSSPYTPFSFCSLVRQCLSSMVIRELVLDGPFMTVIKFRLGLDGGGRSIYTSAQPLIIMRNNNEWFEEDFIHMLLVIIVQLLLNIISENYDENMGVAAFRLQEINGVSIAIHNLRMEAIANIIARESRQTIVIDWRGGGCGRYARLPKALQRLSSIYKPTGLKRNDCFFACVNEALGNDVVWIKDALAGWCKLMKFIGTRDVKIRSSMLREFTRCKAGQCIQYKDLPKLAHDLKCNIAVYGFTLVNNRRCIRPVLNVSANVQRCVRLILYNQHYYLIKGESTVKMLEERASCQYCFKLFADVKRHELMCYRCEMCGHLAKRDSHICRGAIKRKRGQWGINTQHKMVKNNHRSIRVYPKDLIKTYHMNIYFADFEAFGDEETAMIIYSASIIGMEDDDRGYKKPVNFYIENENDTESVIKRFLNICSTLHGTMVFYNGSAFDFAFIHNAILEKMPANEYQKHVKQVIYNDNRIKTFKYRSLVFMDLYLFLRSKLSKACADFGLPSTMWKTSFDHRKVYDGKTAWEAREEVVPYNNMDVICLREIYKRFAQVMWEGMGVNINKFCTLSHMTYCTWTARLSEEEQRKITIPSYDENQFMRRAIYGGRTGPQVRFYESVDRARIHEELKLCEEISKRYYEELKDYLMQIDVVSLYPTVMCYGKFFGGEFEIYTKLSNAASADWANKINSSPGEPLPVIAEVDVQCPSNLLTSYLMARNPTTGELDCNLLPKYNQCYDGHDLAEAVRLGYKIVRVHTICVFQEWFNPFSQYIQYVFEKKKAAPKGSAQYQGWKLILNALYGKLTQRVFDSNWFIFNTEEAVEKASNSKAIKNFKFFEDENGCCNALGLELMNEDPKPSKPVYYGVQILSQARVWMSRYLRRIKGYERLDRMYYYTDTDAYTLHVKAAKIIRDNAKYWGKELGMMDDELEGGRIIGGCFLAPKSYLLEYIKPSGEGARVYWKVRLKGIPHSNSSTDVGKWLHNPPPPINEKLDLNQVIYELQMDNNHIKSRVITWDMLQKVLSCNATLVARFMSMKRYFFNIPSNVSQRSGIIVKTNVSRSLYKTRWWYCNNRRRLLSKHSERSVPLGANKEIWS